MANSEIKAALRTFYREKSYAIINLAGLSLAIACCLILGLYLKKRADLRPASQAAQRNFQSRG